MHSVLNILSEYKYVYISKNIASYTFLLAFKIVETLQCILKDLFSPSHPIKPKQLEFLRSSLNGLILPFM